MRVARFAFEVGADWRECASHAWLVAHICAVNSVYSYDECIECKIVGQCYIITLQKLRVSRYGTRRTLDVC